MKAVAGMEGSSLGSGCPAAAPTPLSGTRRLRLATFVPHGADGS